LLALAKMEQFLVQRIIRFIQTLDLSLVTALGFFQFGNAQVKALNPTQRLICSRLKSLRLTRW
jgi:hypothetical protein